MSFWLGSSKIDQKKYLANQILLLKKILTLTLSERAFIKIRIQKLKVH